MDLSNVGDFELKEELRKRKLIENFDRKSKVVDDFIDKLHKLRDDPAIQSITVYSKCDGISFYCICYKC